MSWDISKGRDPRLDFFRGLAMFIIFSAHVPNNIVTQFIPARFGPSDATEMFIFCSGYAAAIAFGSTFRYAGFWIGVWRILLRIWQIYWAHIGLFLSIAFVCVVANTFLEQDYVQKLNITYFFENTPEAVIGLFSLFYIPNLFDILPIYIIALAFVPVMILLRRIHISIFLLAVVSLYLSTWVFNLELSADHTGRPWFFNPFAWQLLFFTAFAFGSGWLQAPKPQILLFSLAFLYVLAWIPLSFGLIREAYPPFQELRQFFLYGDYTLTNPIGAQIDRLWGGLITQYPNIITFSVLFEHGTPKTNFHLFRYLHILALVYLMMCIFWKKEQLLLRFSPIIKVGQNALPTFLTSIFLSWCGGIFLDQVGREWWSWTLVNLSGFLGLILVAYVAAWYKETPWSRYKYTPKQQPIGITQTPPMVVFSGIK